MPGVNFGIATYSKETGNVKITNADPNYHINYKIDNPKSDTRLNINLALNFQTWGFTAGYSHGIANYRRGEIAYLYDSGSYNQPKVYSQFISAGVYYRLK